MTEPIDVAISRALLEHATVPPLTTPALPFAPPLGRFEPPNGTAYFAAHPLLRADPDHEGLGFNDSTILRGVFQIDAVTPPGAGEAPGLRLAALVAARFPHGRQLVAAGRRLQIDAPPVIAPAISDASWVRFPVSISYIVII